MRGLVSADSGGWSTGYTPIGAGGSKSGQKPRRERGEKSRIKTG